MTSEPVLKFFWTADLPTWKKGIETKATARSHKVEKVTCHVDGATEALEGFCEYRQTPLAFDQPDAKVPHTLFVMCDLTKLDTKYRVPLPFSTEGTLSAFTQNTDSPNPSGRATKETSVPYDALGDRQRVDPTTFIEEYIYQPGTRFATIRDTIPWSLPPYINHQYTTLRIASQSTLVHHPFVQF